MKRKVEVEGWDTQLGVWGRGVDPDLFSPTRRCQDLRRELGLGPNDIAALWLGRVVKEKQPGVWLRVRRTHAQYFAASYHAKRSSFLLSLRLQLSAPRYLLRCLKHRNRCVPGVR